MNVLSKQYRGLFYFGAIALSIIATVLTSPAVADLGWTWVPLATQAVTWLALAVQKFTPIGDKP